MDIKFMILVLSLTHTMKIYPRLFYFVQKYNSLGDLSTYKNEIVKDTNCSKHLFLLKKLCIVVCI
jgi:hypothetical protein